MNLVPRQTTEVKTQTTGPTLFEISYLDQLLIPIKGGGVA